MAVQHDDTGQHDPVVDRRRLRVQLRSAREEAGRTQSEVAYAMDWSPSKLLRIESGAVGISTNDLKALLEYYGLTDPETVDGLVELARSSKAPSRFDGYEDVLTFGFREYLAYEASASSIREHEPSLIPGLLQTEEYARALLTWGWHIEEARRDKIWTVRQARQELHERNKPPQMHFIVDESAIRRQVGRPRVMRRQLEQLKELAARGHIALQILPFSRGAHPGLQGSFAILEFADPHIGDLVHLESSGEQTFRDDPEITAKYEERFLELEGQALNLEDSILLIDAAIAGSIPPNHAKDDGKQE